MKIIIIKIIEKSINVKKHVPIIENYNYKMKIIIIFFVNITIVILTKEEFKAHFIYLLIISLIIYQ